MSTFANFAKFLDSSSSNKALYTSLCDLNLSLRSYLDGDYDEFLQNKENIEVIINLNYLIMDKLKQCQ